MAERARGRDVTVGEILAALKDRGFGVFMILFALPNAVIPGISFILGAPEVLLALQLAFGRDEVWLPEFMRRQKLSAALFEKVAARVQKFLVWVEKRSMPRWSSIVSGAGERLLGLYIAIVAAFLMMPIPSETGCRRSASRSWRWASLKRMGKRPLPAWFSAFWALSISAWL